VSTPRHGRDQDGDPDYGDCLRCGEQLELIGIESFRVGGTSGGWKMMFGELAELGEGMMDLEVFACPECRKVELRVPVN
jgi:DNA-directed RNA polymerase subunit RPC12/RpoP